MSITDQFFPELKLAGEMGRDTRTLERWYVQDAGPPYIRVDQQVLCGGDAVRAWLIAMEREKSQAAGCSSPRAVATTLAFLSVSSIDSEKSLRIARYPRVLQPLPTLKGPIQKHRRLI